MSVSKWIPLGFPSFSKDIVGCSEVMARQEVAGTPKYLLCPLFNEVCAYKCIDPCVWGSVAD